MTNEPAITTLTCPKCAGPMRAYERSGITLDQCTECRGIFLDRGELERLIEAEDVHYGGQPPEDFARRDDRYADAGYPEPDYRGGHDGWGGEHGEGGEHSGGGEHGGYRGGQRRRRGGFLGDLLDFG